VHGLSFQEESISDKSLKTLWTEVYCNKTYLLPFHRSMKYTLTKPNANVTGRNFKKVTRGGTSTANLGAWHQCTIPHKYVVCAHVNFCRKRGAYRSDLRACVAHGPNVKSPLKETVATHNVCKRLHNQVATGELQVMQNPMHVRRSASYMHVKVILLWQSRFA
jgi:hypothetical protein